MQTAGGQDAAVHGHCDDAFRAVGEAFRASFRPDVPDDAREHGAALAVFVDGHAVVDLWGGWADRAATRPWRRDTRALLMSLSKALAAFTVWQLAEAGFLDLDRPVADLWPEFAAHGKDGITVAQVLDHTAGLPVLGDDVRDLGFGQSVWEQALERAEPLHPPGRRHIYHAVTQGFILSGLVRRATGRTLPALFEAHFNGPMGLDCTFGAPSGIDLAEAFLRADHPPGPFPPSARLMAAMRNHLDFNDPEMLAAPLPAFNAVATARDVARLFAGVIAGGGAISPHTLTAATTKRWSDVEESTGRPWRMALGVLLSSPFADFGSGTRAFGHPGSGGVTGFADPDRGLAFAYLPNRPTTGPGTGPRCLRLTQALASCL